MVRRLAFFTVIISMATSLLASCVSVLPEATPAAARYTISPVEFSGDNGARVDWTLAVADPAATRAYDTAKIALTRSPGQIEYYAEGEWTDRAPSLVQTALVRSFENTNRILGVGDAVALAGAEFVLRTDLRALHVKYNGGAPDAVVSVYAKLTDRRGRVIASALFAEEARADEDRVPAVGRAIDAALSAVIADMVACTFETAEAASEASAR